MDYAGSLQTKDCTLPVLDCVSVNGQNLNLKRLKIAGEDS